MSILKGKTINHPNFEINPRIRYIKRTQEFVITVPNFYSKEQENVYIKEFDLYRLINADKGSDELYFLYSEEQGDLDDTTYLGISYVQANYHLSINTLKTAKRVNKKIGQSVFIELQKRIKHGGRPKGAKTKIVFSEDELERLQYLNNNYDRIVENCLKYDWVTEYVALEKDIAKFNRQKSPTRKSIVEKFTELRKRYLNQ